MKQVNHQHEYATVNSSKVVMADSGLSSSFSVHDLKLDAESFVARDEFESALKRIQTLEIELASRETQPK